MNVMLSMHLHDHGVESSPAVSTRKMVEDFLVVAFGNSDSFDVVENAGHEIAFKIDCEHFLTN